MKLLAKEQQDSYENAKICYICKEKFENKYLENKEHYKVTDHVIDNNSLFCMLMYDAIRSSLSKLSRMLGVTKKLGKNLNNFWLLSRARSHVSRTQSQTGFSVYSSSKTFFPHTLSGSYPH